MPKTLLSAFRIWRLLGVAALLLAAVPAEAHVLAAGATCKVWVDLGQGLRLETDCYNDVDAPAGTGGQTHRTHIGNRCVPSPGTSLGTAKRTEGRFGGLNATYRKSMGHLSGDHRLWTNGNGEGMALHIC